MSPGAVLDPSSSSRSNASPVSLAEGGRSAARTAPDLPGSVPDHPPEQPGRPKPPPRLNPTSKTQRDLESELNVMFV